MDKYEFNIKVEQIKKLMKKKDYITAVKIADGIDWEKVKQKQLLIMAADVYEIAGKYDDARDVLLMAYERNGLGRQLAYRLCRLSVKRGDFAEAEEFYEEFTHNSPRDAGKYILSYEISKGRGESVEKQILMLEAYIEEDMDDRWAYELAKLYHRARLRDKCVEMCDTIILWFADGKYVEKALELKQVYAPLSESQRIKYEAQKSRKLNAGAQPIEDTSETKTAVDGGITKVVPAIKGAVAKVLQGKTVPEKQAKAPKVAEKQNGDILDEVHEVDIDVNSIHVKDYSDNNKYDTVNLQRELARNVSSLFDNTIDIFKPNVKKETEPVQEEAVDDQIEGQMSLEEVLAMFESGELQSRSEAKQTESVEEEQLIEEVAEQEIVAELMAEEIAEEINEEIEEAIEEKLIEEKLIEENLIEENLIEENLIEETPIQEKSIENAPLEEDSEEAELDIQESKVETFDLKEEAKMEKAKTEDTKVEQPKKGDVKVVRETVQPEAAKEELKNFIARFAGVQGLDKQILKVMQNILRVEKAPVKFIFVKGEVKSGKTTLAIEVLKLANKLMLRRDQRIAKIKAESINGKSVEGLLLKLDGSDVLIERVSDMEPKIFAEFIDKIKEEGKERIVIFEDEKSLADAFLERVPESHATFANILDIRQNKIKDWTKMASNYAKSQGYAFDEMGVLALSAKIDQLRAITLVVHKDHIEQLVDGAIKSYNKFSFSKLFRRAKGKNEEGLKLLTEKDFMI